MSFACFLKLPWNPLFKSNFPKKDFGFGFGKFNDVSLFFPNEYISSNVWRMSEVAKDVLREGLKPKRNPLVFRVL
jgi:hypothetical protein